jgi:hypothetical protein
MANQMIVNLVNYTKTLEAKLKVYEDNDAEVTSLFINNFLDREKIVEEEYKSKSVYFNILKCKVIKTRYREQQDLNEHHTARVDSLTQDLEHSEKERDHFENIVDLTTNQTLMAVVSQWNIDVSLCQNRNHKFNNQVLLPGYKSTFSENEFLEEFSANIEDSFGELEHNIRIALKIDNSGYNNIELDTWELIIKLLNGIVLLDIDEFMEYFQSNDDYDSDDEDEYIKAIEEENSELLEDIFPNMMCEKIVIFDNTIGGDVRYIVCFND